MEKNKKKQLIVSIIAIVLLIVATVGVTYAFFNYTRTGMANTISVGRIAFNSSQDGKINLTNVFPIKRTSAASDNTNSSEVVITVSGDTTYTQGIEYLVTLEDVNTSVNNKKIPIGIIVTPEKTGELGTSDNSYFTNRGSTTSIYKSFIGESDVIEDGKYVLVGYIRPGTAEVNGTIGIRAFIDADKIAISDTYDGTQSSNMGTTTNWVNNRTVLTTTEWNSLNSTGISFKVRVQANEGVWVGEPTSRNDMVAFPAEITNIKSSITEINFIRMSEEMINTHANLIDLSGANGVVKAWIDGTKLYVASPGETYFPVNSTNLFGGYTNVTKFNFNNVNTSLVTSMLAMFNGNTSLTGIDISSFDTRSVENMQFMFGGCSGLINIDFSYLETSSVTNMSNMFQNCTSLTSANLSGLGSNSLSTVSGLFNGCTSLTIINMSRFNFGSVNSWTGTFNSLLSVNTINLSNANTSNVTNMISMFAECTNLTNLNLTGIDTSSVTDMRSMFQNCTSLTTLDLSSFDTSSVTRMDQIFAMGTKSGNTWTPSNNNLTTIKVGSGWNVNGVTNSTDMFYNCTHLVGGNGTTFDSTAPIDKARAIVDGGTTNPGYMTLKSN